MDYVVSRLREASTYAGIAAVLSGMTFVPHANELAQLLPHIGIVIAGLLAIVLPGGDGSRN